MGISTQRLIIIVVLMNLLIGVVGEMYYEPDSFNTQKVEDEIGYLEQKEVEMESEEGLWGSVKSTASRIYESTIGDPIKWGGTIASIFIRGINPFYKAGIEYTNNEAETFTIYMIGFLRTLIYLVLIVEMYFVWKNKKTT